MDWKTILGAVAPWAASAIGGPLGALAVEAMSGAFGLSQKTESALKAAVSGATPEQMIAAAQADREFAVRMQQMGFTHLENLQALANADRADARQREIKTGDSMTPRLIAFAVIAGFFGILLVMMFRDLPASSKEAALIMLGALGSAFSGVIAYFFGSTAGSAEKTKLLAQSAPPKS